jgi:hypothetical protein
MKTGLRTRHGGCVDCERAEYGTQDMVGVPGLNDQPEFAGAGIELAGADSGAGAIEMNPERVTPPFTAFAVERQLIAFKLGQPGLSLVLCVKPVGGPGRSDRQEGDQGCSHLERAGRLYGKWVVHCLLMPWLWQENRFRTKWKLARCCCGVECCSHMAPQETVRLQGLRNG